MAKLSDQCIDHLEQALSTDDPAEKDFHVRQVLQACGVDGMPAEPDAEGSCETRP